MGGRITLPGGAFYHTSKYAVEGFSDALRMEVGQFGIDVVLIEPGPMQTPWSKVALDSLRSSGSGDTTDVNDPYAAYKNAVAAGFASMESGPMSRLGSTSKDIVEVIVTAVTAKRPRARYLINAVAKSLVATRALLPPRVSDRVIALQFRLPR